MFLIIVKVFNLMSGSNQTRHIEWHETCKCKCKLDASICNNKQRWNNEKYRCECKELIYKGRCDKGFIWNLSNCECECDKSCDVGEYLDSKNCKCRNRIVHHLFEEFSKNIYETEMIYDRTFNAVPLNDYKKVFNSCKLYIVLFVIFLIISTIISSVFIYFHWHLKRSNNEFNSIETKFY